MKQLGKKSIIKKTIEIGASTALSRVLGLARELIFNKYLGVSPTASAFLVAFKIPNFLRRIFAEGALSGALVPAVVGIKDKREVNKLMTFVLIFVQILVLLVCLIVILFPHFALKLAAPGFSAEQVALTIPLMRILIFFILFISGSAVLGSALQSIHHFQIPAWGQVLLNIVFISALYVCWQHDLPVEYLCYAILSGALLHFFMHLFTYFYLGFGFSEINAQAISEFKPLMFKIVSTFIVVGVMEINTWIDGMFASYMKESIPLLHYGSSFMRIPLGVFGVAFSTILLPHFSRVKLYAPKRLRFYLFEGAKLIFFITIPAMMLMSFFAEKIFSTLFLSDKFSMANVIEAKYILIYFLFGLFFFSINRIILNVYYAYHDLMTPMLISLGITAANVGLNWWLVKFMQAPGLALATSIAGAIQTVLYIIMLQQIFDLRLYGWAFLQFIYRFIPLLAVFSLLFYGVYFCGEFFVLKLPPSSSRFMLESYGYWLWVSPLAGIMSLAMLLSRKKFGLKLYFLD